MALFRVEFQGQKSHTLTVTHMQIIICGAVLVCFANLFCRLFGAPQRSTNDAACNVVSICYLVAPGRGTLSERQQKLGAHLRVLQRLAEIYNVAVLCTNQVQADPAGGAFVMVVDPKKPIGGHILAHAATTRLMVKKGRGNQRICKVLDSPDVAEAEAGTSTLRADC